jgi:uncharacterized protein YjbI with pentapeptide repeats
MANDEHVALLKQGVAAWNAWRDEHRYIVPDLSDADLSGANLSKVASKLSGYIGELGGMANLCGVNLGMATLARADLTGADLTGAALTLADLTCAAWASPTT